MFNLISSAHLISSPLADHGMRVKKTKRLQCGIFLPNYPDYREDDVFLPSYPISILKMLMLLLLSGNLLKPGILTVPVCKYLSTNSHLICKTANHHQHHPLDLQPLCLPHQPPPTEPLAVPLPSPPIFLRMPSQPTNQRNKMLDIADLSGV